MTMERHATPLDRVDAPTGERRHLRLDRIAAAEPALGAGVASRPGG
ncbi:MAG: hypothetical protein U0229_20775 [Anaeromyxobacter sp.]